MASHLKKRKRHRVQKKRVLRMPLSLGISYFGLGMQRMKINSQFLKVQADSNSWDKMMADPHMVQNPSLPAKNPQLLFHKDGYPHRCHLSQTMGQHLFQSTAHTEKLVSIQYNENSTSIWQVSAWPLQHTAPDGRTLLNHVWKNHGAHSCLLIQMTELNGSVGSLSQAERNCVWPPDHREHEWLIKITPWSNNNVSGHYFATYIAFPTYDIAYV